MAKSDYDHKLKITLTLTAEEASDLLDTLAAGASAQFAPTLQARSNGIKQLVQRRYDAAVQARRRARLRADQRKLAYDRIRAMNVGAGKTITITAEEATRLLDDRSNNDA